MEKVRKEETPFLQSKGISSAKAGVHSGFSETSQLLVSKPRLVKMEYAEQGLVDESFYRPENIPRSQMDSFIHGIKHFSKNGILGDPRGANKEVGEALWEIVVRILADEIKKSLAATGKHR
jgi:creatinine amidohydrolase/Fe(II)-dependent formamide hydrolase-like protein